MAADNNVHWYTVGRRLMDGAQIANDIQKTGQTAIVRDLEQSLIGGAKGDYYEVYFSGVLRSAFATRAEAEDAVVRYTREDSDRAVAEEKDQHTVQQHEIQSRSKGGTQDRIPDQNSKTLWRRRRVLLISLILAVVTAVTVSVVLLTRSSPEQKPPPIQFIAAGPGGSLIEDTPEGNVILWNIASKRVTAALTDPGANGVESIAASGNGSELAVEDGNGSTYVWNVTRRRVAATVSVPENEYTNDVALSADGKTLAEIGDNDQQVLVWDVVTRRSLAKIQVLPASSDGSSSVDDIALNPDGKYMAVSVAGSDQPGVEVWNIATRQIAAELSSDYGGDQLIFSPNGQTLVIVGDGAFTLWYVLNGVLTEATTLTDPTAAQILNSEPADSSAAFNPFGTTLATADGSTAGDVFLWNLRTYRLIATFTDPESQGVVGLAYSPDGRTLIAADGNGRIYLWNTTTRKVFATLYTTRH